MIESTYHCDSCDVSAAATQIQNWTTVYAVITKHLCVACSARLSAWLSHPDQGKTEEELDQAHAAYALLTKDFVACLSA